MLAITILHFLIFLPAAYLYLACGQPNRALSAGELTYVAASFLTVVPIVAYY